MNRSREELTSPAPAGSREERTKAMRKKQDPTIKRIQALLANRRHYQLHPDQLSTPNGQFNSPAWRRYRLRILIRDDFKCQKCGVVIDVDTDSFCVKRKIFDRADMRLLCDIPADELVTMCRPCSKIESTPNKETDHECNL